MFTEAIRLEGFRIKADCFFKAANFRFRKASTGMILFCFFFFLPVEEAAFLLTSQVRNDTQGIFKKIVTAGFSVQSSRGFDFFRGSNKSTLFLRHANPSTDTQIKRSLTVNKSSSQKYCNASSFRRVFNDRVYRL